MIDTHIEYIIKQMPTLETDRLRLRKLTKHDATDMFEYASLQEVTRFLTWSPHESPAYTKKYVRYLVSQYRSGEFLDWAIALKENDRMIGTCGFTSIDIENSTAEIGYVLNPAYHKNGFASEAVRCVMEYVFGHLEFNRAVARVIEGNEDSVKLLQRLGFRQEGTGIEELFVKGRFVNVMHFAISKKEFDTDEA